VAPIIDLFITFVELKKSLYHVFSQFGNILEINLSKTLKMRGQAWIIFDDIGSATKALREMQSFNFYGKPMRVAFARAKSDVVAKIDGSFAPRPKRKPDTDKDKSEKKEQKKAKKQAPAKKDDKKVAASSAAAPMQTDEEEAPNKKLFLQNLPPMANETMIAMLFDKYQGYQEAQLVPNKPGIAFVEFTDAYSAGVAKEGLQGFKITPELQMKITFAK